MAPLKFEETILQAVNFLKAFRLLHKEELNTQNLNFIFSKYQVLISIQLLSLVLTQHFEFRRIFKPHLMSFRAEESSIHRKRYQDEFLKIHIAVMRDHNSLCKLFQMLHYLNMLFLNFVLLLIKECFILTFKYFRIQIGINR